MYIYIYIYNKIIKLKNTTKEINITSQFKKFFK